MLIKFIVSLFSIIFLISCNHQKEEKLSNPLVLIDGLLYTDSLSATPFTGRHKSKMLNMKIEYEVINGIREGDFIIYFPNDMIEMIGTMKNNKNTGAWKYYYDNGTLQTSGFFENDIPTGKWIWYDTLGRVIEEGDFLNGNKEGEWNSYDSTGRLDIVRLFKNDKLLDSAKVN